MPTNSPDTIGRVDFRNLAVASYTNGITVWSYKTPHSRRVIEGSDYWTEALVNNRGRPRMAVGDWIMVTHMSAIKADTVIGGSLYMILNDNRAKILASTFNNGDVA